MKFKNNCEFCSKEIITTDARKRFCDRSCNARYHSKLTYEKNKNNPEFRKNNYNRLTKWIDENREHFNQTMREPNRLRAIERRKHQAENNLCRICGKKLEDIEYKSCEICRKKFKENYLEKKYKRLKGEK